jgi:D-alanine-D-alanine ligase
MKIIIITSLNEDLTETGFGPILSCKHVLESVKAMGHAASIQICNTEHDLNFIVKLKPDLVILAVKYLEKADHQKIWLTDFFSSNGINYTGSPKEVLDLDPNKISAKLFLQDKKIKTAKYFTALPSQYKKENELPLKLPLFLKPSNATNGDGIDDSSLVLDFKSYEKKILSLYQTFNQPILVEEYLDGREFTVAVIQENNKDLIVSAIEIIPPKSLNGLRVLGSKVKNGNSEVLLKIQDLDLIKEVKELAVKAFKNLGGRDYGRIDIQSNLANECFFMEANLLPGMTATSSYFPRACNLDLEIPYDQVIELILSQGIKRVPVQLQS